jgi:hypothetical protein
VKTKEELEKEINETAISYFSIAGENTENLRKTGQLKLIACVFEYCKKYMYSRKDEFGFEEAGAYSFEIYECVGKCIVHYNPGAGEFLHYFMRSIKYAIRRSRRKEILEDDKTMSFDGTAEDAVFAENDTSVASKEASKLPGPQEEFASFEEMEALFDVIERVFCKKQERVKQYLSALITAKHYDEILRFGFKKRYAFVYMPIIKDAMKNRGHAPSQKGVAEYFNKKEADASRTLNKFFKEVAVEIKEMQSQGKL